MPLQKILKFKFPDKIDKATKELIEKSYFDAVTQMGVEEFDYICNKIEQKLTSTAKAATSWIVEMSSFYKVLFDVYNNDRSISESGFNLIGAALFYFINPFDVIPDYTHGIGYLDDLYIVILCLRSLNKKDKEIIRKYLSDRIE